MAELSEGAVGVQADEGFGVLEVEVAVGGVASGGGLGVGNQYTYQITQLLPLFSQKIPAEEGIGALSESQPGKEKIIQKNGTDPKKSFGR